MNDIIALQDAILNADIENIFDSNNHLTLALEKESAKENRRNRKNTAKVQKKRLNTIAKAEGLIISNPVEYGKNRNHATYSHIDFNSDGSYALNRIVNKESKGQISGWKCPSKRSKTQNLAVIAAEAFDELAQNEADMAEIETNAKLNEQKLKREAILAEIDDKVDDIMATMKADWEDMAVSLFSAFVRMKENF